MALLGLHLEGMSRCLLPTLAHIIKFWKKVRVTPGLLKITRYIELAAAIFQLFFAEIVKKYKFLKQKWSSYYIEK